jgi:hypothetical protein
VQVTNRERERFQRSLIPTVRREREPRLERKLLAEAAPRLAPARSRRELSEPVRALSADRDEDDGEPNAVESVVVPSATTPALAPAAPRPPAPLHTSAAQDRAETLPGDNAESQEAGNAPAIAAQRSDLALALGRTVCEVYDHADGAFENWTVLVPVDPEVLPETELRMTLTPHRLSLRFNIQSSLSHALVLQNQPRLQRMLQRVFTPQRDVDIELT